MCAERRLTITGSSPLSLGKISKKPAGAGLKFEVNKA